MRRRRLNATLFPPLLLWYHGGKSLDATNGKWINKSLKINADIGEKSAYGHPAQWSLQRNGTSLSVKPAHWYSGHAFPSYHVHMTPTSDPTRHGEPQRIAMFPNVPWTPHSDLLPWLSVIRFARHTLWLLAYWPCLCFAFFFLNHFFISVSYQENAPEQCESHSPCQDKA